MIWLLFTGKIRKIFGIPQFFHVFKDDDNGKMFKFITCGIILLLLSLVSLGSLGCIAVTSIGGGPAAPAAPTTPASVPTPNIRMR